MLNTIGEEIKWVEQRGLQKNMCSEVNLRQTATCPKQKTKSK